MKVRSSFGLAGLLALFALSVSAAIPGDKRTILTSGEKVYTIHYQLGQSTVLYFGLRPETVICGNKNYFNIEKLKDSITIQPLSNFSTNLTIMAQGRRYLFFLTPASGTRPDGFVEVKWVPANQVRAIKPLASLGSAVVRELAQRAKVGGPLEMTIVREKSSKTDNRRIFELELKNLGSGTVGTNTVEVVAAINGHPLDRQVLAWESEELKSTGSVKGRVIVTGYPEKSLSLVVGYQGKSTKMIVKGGRD